MSSTSCFPCRLNDLALTSGWPWQQRVCDVLVRGAASRVWGVIAIPGYAEGVNHHSEGNRDDGRHVGAGRAGAQEGVGFSGENVLRLLSSSPEFRELCREVLGGGRGFREFELDLRGALLGGAAAVSAGLSAPDAESGAPACGACGSAMVRRGTRSTAPLSLLGPLSLRRGYWTCGCSKGGRHVLDETLGIAGRDGARGTPAVLWALAELASDASFEKAAARLGRLAGVEATAKRAERRNAKTGLPERDAGSARHTAAIDSAASRDVDAEPSAFARRLWRAAERFGFAAAKRQVVVADGAKWIWNAAAELFPNAVCIVDIRHARERLWEVGRAVYGAGTELCRAWSEKVCAALSEGRVEDVLRELRRHAGDKTADQCVGYFENNRGRMRYPAYREMGLLIGSGMVESSCRALVGERLKCSGMRWSRAGANDVMALRSCVRDERYDDFWRRRRKPAPMAA